MRILISLFLALGMLLPTAILPMHTTAQSSGYDAEDLLAIKPELRETVAAQLPTGMTEYEIELEIPDANLDNEIDVSGWQRVTVTNRTPSPLFELPFRLYGNGAYSDHNILEIDSIEADGESLDWELSELDSVAMVALPGDLHPGEQVTLEMEFTLTIPVNAAAHYGLLNHSTESQTTVLAHWYPVLAGRDPETGWMLKPSSIFGDPIFTEAGLYDVTVTVPSGKTVVTSGVETDRSQDGEMESISFNAKPSRDFVIVLSDTLESVSTNVDGTEVFSWFRPHHADPGEAVLDWTVNSLEVFNPLLGEYPWVQLQAIDAVVFNAAAIELPQMFIMGTSYYDGSGFDEPGSYFEFTVAHEAVHMWFYSIVGNNQYDDAFIDEGLTNYLSADIYFREVYGDEFGDTTFQRFVYGPFQRLIEGNADMIVDHPTDNFPNSNTYVNAVYTKAPVGFQAIHTAMGDDAFFGGLQAYVEQFSWRVAAPSDLEAALQAHTDIDIRELWSLWFERRTGSLNS